jgi:hypothetical protein
LGMAAELNGKRPKCDGHACKARWKPNLAEPLHDCPYQSDVNNNTDYRCSCCDACRQNCADDV